MGRHPGTEHAAAALVAVDLLCAPSSSRSSTSCSIRPCRSAQRGDRGACSAIRRRGQVEDAIAEPRRRRPATLDAGRERFRSTRSPARCRARALRRRRRPLGLPGQLRPVPRHRRRRLAPAIPTSTTTTGCGAARSPTSTQTITLRHPVARRPGDPRLSRCRPSAPTMLEPAQIDAVAEYRPVALRRRSTTRRSRPKRGTIVFADNCALPRRRWRQAATARFGAPTAHRRDLRSTAAARRDAIVGADSIQPRARRHAGAGARPARADSEIKRARRSTSIRSGGGEAAAQ